MTIIIKKEIILREVMKNMGKKKGSLAASPFLTKPNPIFLTMNVSLFLF